MVRRRRSAAGDLTENPAAAKERSLPLSRAATTTAPIAPVFRFPAGNQSPEDRPVGKGIRRNIFCDDDARRHFRPHLHTKKAPPKRCPCGGGAVIT